MSPTQVTVTVTEIIVRDIRKALARARKTAMSESKPREYSKGQSPAQSP